MSLDDLAPAVDIAPKPKPRTTKTKPSYDKSEPNLTPGLDQTLYTADELLEDDASVKQKASDKSFSEETVTESISENIEKGEQKGDTESYEDDFDTEVPTESISELAANMRLRKAVKASDVGVQTSVQDQLGLAHHWTAESGYAVLGPQYGAEYTDPTPVATHVVNPDALEAMTSYSPSVLVLNDLLRQLHEFYSNSLQADHSYTTLQDTLQDGFPHCPKGQSGKTNTALEANHPQVRIQPSGDPIRRRSVAEGDVIVFIQEHRRSVLTMEEALQQVQNSTDGR
ncbi:hypothetical protein Bbelb_342200 [Branchiostoma belcheri]|nr:hypothetical protein Bbelb_342200 [Branchiostoma belcheri]